MVANWAAPKLPIGVWAAVYGVKWWIAGAALGLTILSVRMWFTRDERSEWYGSTWGYALFAVPAALVGTLAFERIAFRVRTEHFRPLVLGLLVLSAVASLASVLR